MEFRPNSLEHLFGQDHIKPTLTTWANDHTLIPKSILLQGPFGCGKTSIARMIAGWLKAKAVDIHEINAAEARGIDDVRGWAEASRFAPLGPSKVYIIDELHQMTTTAQAALLKVIEEPPKGTYYILCTTEPGKLLPALRSRCVPLTVKTLTREETLGLLALLSGGKMPPDLAERIWQATTGHARDVVKACFSCIANNYQVTIQAVLDSNYLNQAAQVLLDTATPAAARQELLGQIMPYLSAVFLADPIHATSIFDQFVDRIAFSIKDYPTLLLLRAQRRQYLVRDLEYAQAVVHSLNQKAYETKTT